MTHIWPDHCRQLVGSRCVWYSKTNISRMLVRQTDTQHVDILRAKPGSSAGSERPRKVSTTNQRRRSSLRQSTGAVGWPGESDTRKRGEYRGNSSQAKGRKCPLQKVSSREICLAAVTPRRSPDAASAQLFGSPGWKQSSDPNCLHTWIGHPPPFLETRSAARPRTRWSRPDVRPPRTIVAHVWRRRSAPAGSSGV
jgi:hypothetical protein